MKSIFILHGSDSSNIIETLGEVIQNKTLTFQFILVYTSKILKNNSYRINFISRLHPFANVSKIGNSTITEQLSAKTSTHLVSKVYSLQSPNTLWKSYIHLDVLDLWYNGGQVGDCIYGGFSVYDVSELDLMWHGKHHPEIFLQCKSGIHIGGKHLVRSLISSREAFIVILYSYAQYSNISFSLNISYTDCQGVFIGVYKWFVHPLHFTVKQRWNHWIGHGVYELYYQISIFSKQCLALQLYDKEGQKKLCRAKVHLKEEEFGCCLSSVYFFSSDFKILGEQFHFSSESLQFYNCKKTNICKQ